jgi:putative glutamine amidotransferase
LQAVGHDVRLDPESRLARVLGETEFTVQSVHHQAVGRLGNGLRAVAWAEDGVVEAVESERHAFLIGVQWHPERDALSDPRPMRLFEELMACADGYRGR